jgi:hypothetical protein
MSLDIKSSFPGIQSTHQQPLREDELIELISAIDGFMKEQPDANLAQLIYNIFNQFIIIPKHPIVRQHES